MTLIREFEERVNQDFLAGRITGAVHLYSGEEAVAVGVCLHLRDDDYVTSTHRPHGHCLAKGLDPKAMMAELYGKTNGLCHGKGGSMHMGDMDRGMLGANGIVAAGLPLACGAALRAKVLKTSQVAVSFLGDGATNAGGFHESLNLAAVLRLPVVFVIENNGYADATHVRYAAPVTDLSIRATAYGIPGVTVDGNDVFAVAKSSEEAISRARNEHLPYLLECKTYRYHGHFIGDVARYRMREELEAAKKADCLLRFEETVLREGWISKDELHRIREESQQAVVNAVHFAEASPLPRPEECLDAVFVKY
jgi:pyruvate dehydrogenase E1 component alpha subunit